MISSAFITIIVFSLCCTCNVMYVVVFSIFAEEKPLRGTGNNAANNVIIIIAV